MELIFVYLLKVVERPGQNKRYNAPHLDSMRYVCTRNVHSHITIQEMSAARLSFDLENFHIFNKDISEKHFQYVCYLSNSTTKLKIIFEMNNTLWGHCSNIILRNGSAIKAQSEILVE